jgi:hypothetical protein
MVNESITEKPVLTKDEVKYQKEILKMENEGNYYPPPPPEGLMTKLKLIILRIFRALKHIFQDRELPPENPPSQKLP